MNGNFYTLVGGGISRDTGMVVPNTDDRLYTPFVLLNKQSDIVVSGYRSTGNITPLAFYDKDQVFISAIFDELPAGNVIDYRVKKENFPINAHYIRSSGRTDMVNNLRNNTIQFLSDYISNNTSELNLSLLYPRIKYANNILARNAVPKPFRKPNLTLKYVLEDDSAITEISKGSTNFTSDENWWSEREISYIDTEDSTYLYCINDKEGRVVFAIDREGKAIFNPMIQHVYEVDWEYPFMIIDDENKIIFAIDTDGKIITKGGVFESESKVFDFQNNLKNQEDLMSSFDFEGMSAYGTQHATYEIKSNFKGRISVKGRIKSDLNSDNSTAPFISFTDETGNVQQTLSTKHAKPTQAQDAHTNEPLALIPVARLSSGFSCNGTDMIYDRVQRRPLGDTKYGGRNNLCGDKVMMFWFKGKETVTRGLNIRGYQRSEDWGITSDWTNMPIEIEPSIIDGKPVGIILQLTPYRIYRFTGKVSKVIIADIRRETVENDFAWGSSSRAFITPEWADGIQSPVIEFGNSGIVLTGDSEIPVKSGYSVLTCYGLTCSTKNYKERVFSNYYTYSEIMERSKMLATYNDLYVDISNDTLTFGRDSTGIIWSTSLKSGSNWKTLRALYEEMIPPTTNDNYPNEANPHATIPELNDFYITFVNMSYYKRCDSLLQVGKIYLIGQYLQQPVPNQIGHGNAPYYPPRSLVWDCYPYFVYDKYDTQEHVFDIILDDKDCSVYVNGERISQFNKTERIVVGNVNSDILMSDLQINKGSLGDAEIMSDPYYLVSERTPYCLTIFNHNIYDTYQGSNHPLGNSGISPTKVYYEALELQSKGYRSINLRDFSDWKRGVSTIPKKSFLIQSDDWRMSDWWWDLNKGSNPRIRRSFEKYGIKMNVAQVLDRCDDTTTPLDCLNFRLAGHDVCSHSRFHNDQMQSKPSIQVWIEMIESRFIVRKFSMNEEMFTLYKSGGSIVSTHDILDYFGFVSVIDSSIFCDKYTRRTTNNFATARLNMGGNSLINPL